MKTNSEQMCKDLVALVKHIKNGMYVLAEKHGLTHMQLYVMNFINEGDVTMGSVAGNLHCDASNITGIIDRLVAQGLVVRHESQKDRRAKLLYLTDKGRQVIDDVTEEMPMALGCDKLSASECSTLHNIVTRLT